MKFKLKFLRSKSRRPSSPSLAAAVFSEARFSRTTVITSENEIRHPGTCLGCGVRTHKIKMFRTKPITTAYAYKGVCIACHSEDVPRSIVNVFQLAHDSNKQRKKKKVVITTYATNLIEGDMTADNPSVASSADSSTDLNTSEEEPAEEERSVEGPVEENSSIAEASVEDVQDLSYTAPKENAAEFNDVSALNAASEKMTQALSSRKALSIHDAVEMLTETAENAAFVKKFFPGAIGSSQVLSQVAPIIERMGFTPENTLFAQSICPDEINHEPNDLPNLFADHLGEVFHMGGLAGVPFTGKTGFQAFSHHVPESGHLFILMAPHVGVSNDLKLGQYSRIGQTHSGSACGAACGALAHCCANKPLPDLSSAEHDYQMAYLMHQIHKRRDLILSNKDENAIQAALAQQTYEIAQEMLNGIVSLDFGGRNSSLVLLTGIQINMPDPFEDYFQPLSFEMFTKDGVKHDLFADAF